MIIDLDAIVGFWPWRHVDISPERLLAGMARKGIDQACVCSARGVCYDYLAGNLETLALTEKHPNLIPVATLDPREYVNCREEIRHMMARGVRLYRLFPEYQAWSFNSPAARRVVNMVEDAGAILLTGGTPAAVLPVVRDLTIPVVLTMAHLYDLADLLAAAEECPNLYASTRLLIGPGAIETAASDMGHQRLLFGSHAPLAYQASAFRMVATASVTAEQRADILGGNLERMLGGNDAHS